MRSQVFDDEELFFVSLWDSARDDGAAAGRSTGGSSCVYRSSRCRNSAAQIAARDRTVFGDTPIAELRSELAAERLCARDSNAVTHDQAQLAESAGERRCGRRQEVYEATFDQWEHGHALWCRVHVLHSKNLDSKHRSLVASVYSGGLFSS